MMVCLQGLYSLLSPYFVSASWWLGPRPRQPFPLWCPNCDVQLWICRLVSAGPGEGRYLSPFFSNWLNPAHSEARTPSPVTRVDHPLFDQRPIFRSERLSERHPSTVFWCVWGLVPLGNESHRRKSRGMGLAVPAVNH